MMLRRFARKRFRMEIKEFLLMSTEIKTSRDEDFFSVSPDIHVYTILLWFLVLTELLYTVHYTVCL